MPNPHPLEVYCQREGLSQAGLAEKLGVASASVSRYITRARRIERRLRPKFSEITGIPEAALEELVPWEPPTASE